MVKTMNDDPFYAQLADVYDEMTRFESRIKKERPVFEQWVSRLHIRRALDAACGTGIHAILLASLGVKVTGVDASPAMIEKARQNARRLNADVSFSVAKMQNLREAVEENYDTVFCLGNSVPHLLEKSDLEQAMRNFYALLQPGGHVVLQLLNYEKILQKRERVVGVHRANEKLFVRFYDFLPERVRFNVLTVQLDDPACPHRLQSSLLVPYRKDHLKEALLSAGFGDLAFYGTMGFQEYDPQKSPNLVIVGRKPL